MGHMPNLVISDGLSPGCKAHCLRVGKRRGPKGHQGDAAPRERDKAAGQARLTDAHDTG